MHTPTQADARRRTLRVALLCVAVLVLGSAHTVSAARQQKPPPTVEATDLANRIHVQINAKRKKHGLHPLAWNVTLSKIAAKHSHDMANRRYLGHASPEGKNFSDRYQQDGFACEIRIDNLIYAGAENIALSRLYNSMTTENDIAYYNWNSVQEIALKTVDGWMNSPGHRKNILTPYWRQEGIGIEIAPDNKIYITQNFC